MSDSLRPCPECGDVDQCFHDAMRQWAVAQLIKESRRRSPGAKLRSGLSEVDRGFRKKVAAGRRSIAAKHAAKVQDSKRRLAELHASVDRRFWELLLENARNPSGGSNGPGGGTA